jgi:hypothetical protein
MSVVDDTPEERDFRERYALELRKKKVERYISSHFGSDELSDEMKKVKRQEMVSPGRRGEQIKLEEISKEIIRRLRRKSVIPMPQLMLKCKTCGA